jgi:flagellar P-ring protein FlgI
MCGPFRDAAMMHRTIVQLICLSAVVLFAPDARAGGVRIKDITDFEGSRSNQLFGVGLVVGLNGTGSKSINTQQVAINMLQKLGINGKVAQINQLDPVFKSNSVSVVMVTAQIGPFARCGSRIDVTVSVTDDSTSLQGGTLVLTPLQGADGEVYAVAQGPLLVGGFAFGGKSATSQKNHPTVGRVADGANIEREAPGQIVCNGVVSLLLREPDYHTARSIAKVINDLVPYSAIAINAGTVHIRIPRSRIGNPVAFACELGLLEVSPDVPARVVINERTGTIVAGEQVKLTSVAVASGNLAIVTNEAPEVSQPLPFSRGRTTVVPRSNVGVSEQTGVLNVVEKSVTVAELARALNALGVTPRDLIEIFQALKQAGALHAELVIM